MDSKSIAKAKAKLIGLAASRKSGHHPTGKSTKAESEAFSKLNMEESSGSKAKAKPVSRLSALSSKPSPVPKPRVATRPSGPSLRDRMAARMASR